jgi:hypothetical protein
MPKEAVVAVPRDINTANQPGDAEANLASDGHNAKKKAVTTQRIRVFIYFLRFNGYFFKNR